jgi:hypothetical protein
MYSASRELILRVFFISKGNKFGLRLLLLKTMLSRSPLSMGDVEDEGEESKNCNKRRPIGSPS